MNHGERPPRPRGFWWSAHADDVPTGHCTDDGWEILDAGAYQQPEEHITAGHHVPRAVPDWAEDIFHVARAVFMADKRLRRDDAPDGWTRRLALSVPVTAPDRWRAPAALSHLTTVLETMTSDAWELDFRPLNSVQRQEPLPLTDPADLASEVALFSGGLDSLSWAATRVGAVDDRRLLLVTVREVSLEGVQKRAFTAVERLSRGRTVECLRLNLVPAGREGERRGLEPSSRTRGLLYLAAAIRWAAAHGVGTVYAPENGQLAINPPLTAARLAACSTRSVHPWTLHHFNALVGAVSGGEAVVRVVNPLAHLTKGQVCRDARTAGLSPVDLETTVSCGYSPKRWPMAGPCPANCGFCFPCLVRRSALTHANGTDGTWYLASPWCDGRPMKRAEDWRALQRWLHTPFTLRDLFADLPLPPETDSAAVLDVITCGQMELRNLDLLAGQPS